MDKRRKKRVWFLTVLATVAALSLFVFSGCAKLASAINDIKGSLIGNQYTIYTYDNFGNLVLETSGKKIDIAGNPVKNTSYDENGKVITGYELSSVITITIDGNEIESCGDTCIFVQKGLTPDVDFTTETIQSSGSVLDITSLSAKLNQYKNKFGKARVVVIKSQLGNPIMAFSGDSVYWEIPESGYSHRHSLPGRGRGSAARSPAGSPAECRRIRPSPAGWPGTAKAGSLRQ